MPTAAIPATPATPAILAIVSKKVFDKECLDKTAGALYDTAGYESTHKALEALSGGGALFLVTVRPPTERLWLVAILEQPTKGPGGWTAAKNAIPITDITALRPTIQFESGKGISQKAGAMGMSLQTPRALSAADVAALRAAVGTTGAALKAPMKKRAAKKATKKNAKKNAKGSPPAARPEPTPGPDAQGVIQYSDEARKFLRPTDPAGLPKVKSRKALWGEWSASWDETYRFEPEASKPLDEEVRLACALLDAPAEPPELSRSIAAVMVRLTDRVPDDKSIGYLVARFGAVEALEVLIEAHRFAKDSHPARLSLASADEPITVLAPTTIYKALLRADEDTRERCAKRAEALYPDARFELRIALLSCLPTRPEWADEIARLGLTMGLSFGASRDLLSGSVTDSKLLADIITRNGVGAAVVNALSIQGEKVALALGTLLGDATYPNEQKAFSRALACIGTEETAAIFATHLRKKHVRPYATDFFARFPHLAAAALEGLAKKRTQVGGVARAILDNVAKAGDLRATSTAEFAEGDEIPAILRDPPWHRDPKERPKRKPLTVLGLELPTEPTCLHWGDLDRHRWAATQFREVGGVKDANATAKFQEKLKAGENAYLYGNYPAEVAIPLLAAPPPNLHIWRDTPGFMLALHGTKALAAVLASIARGDHLDSSVSIHIESPLVAAWLAESGKLLRWADRFPEAAALGLVPPAVGGDKDARGAAERGLRHLARGGHRQLVLSSAERHGDACVAAVEEVLAWDERYDCPKKPPRMPPYYRPAELRPPRLENGKALPTWAVARLGEMLHFSDWRPSYIGLDEVRRACEPRSLAEHAWDIAKAWDTNSTKGAHSWMLHAVAHFGDDEVVRRLTPALRGEGISPMLGRIGTDAALMELRTILARLEGQQGRSPKYAWGADEAVQTIADNRGVSRESLEEQLIPTYNVDADGGVTLDLGSRTYRVTFDARLAPVLRNEDGELVRALPRGSKADDPDKVAAATLVWTDLREDVAAMGAQRAQALERAMLDDRLWSRDDFRRVWLDHPLMIHMARAVVWQAVDEGGAPLRAFRIAEDRSFADAADEALPPLDDAAQIMVAHFARLSEKERHGWQEIFEDYQLMSPIRQLERAPAILAPEHQEASALSAPRGVEVEVIQSYLRGLGWTGRGKSFCRAFPKDIFGIVDIDRDRKVRQITAGTARYGLPCPLGEVDATVFSELMRILLRFRQE